jgi:two-component system OmpR family sensor kinase
MFRLLRVAAWPLVVKVPVLVAGLMVAVAVAISQIVLWRFVHDQESNLGQLSSAYLDGLSGAVLPAIIRGDVWEVFDALDRARRTPYAGVQSRFAVVELPSGTVLAASDPVRFSVESAVPDELRSRFAADDDFLIDAAAGRAWLARTLRTEGFSIGRLFAEIDIADSLRDRREILVALILVNVCLTLAFGPPTDW